MTSLARATTASGRARHEPLPHVLVVEPDPSIASVALMVLLDLRCLVTTVPDPGTAIPLLWETVFDLVLTDDFAIWEEVSSGTSTPTDWSLAACRSAALVPLARDTPVIMWSTYPFSVTQAQAAGFHDVLTKPCELEHFEAQVRPLLWGIEPEPSHTSSVTESARA